MLDREDFVTLIKEETERVGSGVQESGFLDQVITKAREQGELWFFWRNRLRVKSLKNLDLRNYQNKLWNREFPLAPD